MLQASGIDPGQRRCGKATVEMIGESERIAGLALGAADLLFDLLETGLDIPSLIPL
jgi:hypothetical protein